MSFSVIGNMNTYLRSMEMKSMWYMKKNTGDYTQKGATSMDQFLEQMADSVREGSGEQDETLSEILQKVYMGRKLTSEEKIYLRDHAPDVYSKVVSLEQEQKAYERELRRCETKEDVERVRMNRINGSLATVNAVDNNPYISDAKKMEIIGWAKRRLDAIAESTRKFVASGQYGKLPTEAEEAAARKEEMEELYSEIRQEEQLSESGQDAKVSDRMDVSDETAHSGDENSLNQIQKFDENAVARRDEIDIETDEERKVRRAKVKAAYASVYSESDSVSDSFADFHVKV